MIRESENRFSIRWMNDITALKPRVVVARLGDAETCSLQIYIYTYIYAISYWQHTVNLLNGTLRMHVRAVIAIRS